MPDTPVRVSFPRGVWAALAVVGLLQVGGILTQLVVVEDQRRTVRDQREIAERQRSDAEPLVDQAKPLVRAALEGLPETRRLGRELSHLTREATPVAAELKRAPLASAIRGGSDLAFALLSADLPRTLRSAGWVSGELLHRQRLRRLLRRSLTMLAEVRGERLVSKAARAAEMAPRMLAIQTRLLRIQTRTLDRIETMLAVARETERHAESIDRKTGGELPTP
ncbi:MAG: hypothetical protein QOJ81_1912 [Chloroflexota bacterium]|nr:hypothetical protein [Chloroflexota bacterium]